MRCMREAEGGGPIRPTHRQAGRKANLPCHGQSKAMLPERLISFLLFTAFPRSLPFPFIVSTKTATAMDPLATEHEEMPIALGERLASNSPQDAGHEQSSVVDLELQPNQILKRYFQDKSPDFRRVDNLRQQVCWHNSPTYLVLTRSSIQGMEKRKGRRSFQTTTRPCR
jgi:hypothetical protein